MNGPPLKILLFGGSGQVGRALLEASSLLPVAIAAPGRQQADFRAPSALAAIVRAAAPDVVINAAAYTAVDQAESEPEIADLVNAKAPAALAAAADALGVPLIHYSTDYVFDGAKPAPYLETDAVNPLSVYGRTKASGEALMRERHSRHVIIRTSWVHGPHGRNFVTTMLKLAETRRALQVVDDQRGAPTAASDIAAATMRIVARLASGENHFGTFHFTGAGETTWRGFAERVFVEAASAGRLPPVVHPIATESYPTAARRPRNSRLDCTRIADVYGVRQRPWELGVAEAVQRICLAPGVAA